MSVELIRVAAGVGSRRSGRRAATASAAAIAAIAAAISVVPAVAGAAPGAPSGAVVRNGIVSTVGGCQSPSEIVVKLCSQAEAITADYPAQLRLNPGGSTFVVLGAGLTADGKTRPVLESRLRTALRAHRDFPGVPIIVSGGVPRAGVTEAGAMKRWLVGAGVPGGLITKEDRSTSTVQNAAFSTEILRSRGSQGAVVVTSFDHLRRAMINFRTVNKGAFPVSGIAAY